MVRLAVLERVRQTLCLFFFWWALFLYESHLFFVGPLG